MNIQAVSQVQAAPIQREGAQGPAFAAGDVLSAEVTSVGKGLVSLQLSDGQVVNASQKSFATLRAGDQVVLSVQGNESPNQPPKLQLLSVNGQPLPAEVSTTEYTLLRMRILPTQANLSIAEAATATGQSIRPELFARMSDLSLRFPSLPPEQALLFAASSLPLDGETVQAFSQWIESPAHTPEFTTLLSSLAHASPEAAALLNAAAAAAKGQPAAPSAPAAQSAQRAPANPLAGLSPEVASLLENSGLPQTLGTLPPEQAQAQILQFMMDLPPSLSSAERGGVYNALKALANPPENPGQAAPASAPAAETALPAQAAELPQAANTPASTPANTALPAQAVAQEQALPELVRTLFTALDAFPAGEGGEALKDAAASLSGKLKSFTSALESQLTPGREAALKPVLEMGQTLATQIQMGGEMGNLLCMQIPVTFRDQQREAGLYVLKRDGRGGQIDESNATIAVCLETENLGQVDTLLYVERDQLSLQFRVDNPGIERYVQSRLKEVAKLDFPPRYRFAGATVRLKDAALTPANAGKVLNQAFGRPAPQQGFDISV